VKAALDSSVAVTGRVIHYEFKIFPISGMLQVQYKQQLFQDMDAFLENYYLGKNSLHENIFPIRLKGKC
jgi:hypothetical protein